MKTFIQMNYFKKITFAILFMAIPLLTLGCSDDDDDNGGNSGKTIVEVAQDNPELSTLVDAIVAAGLSRCSYQVTDHLPFLPHLMQLSISWIRNFLIILLRHHRY